MSRGLDTREQLKNLFNRIYKKLDWGVGRQLAYHEGGGEIFSPIKAGMDMQQIWDNIKRIMEFLDFKWSNVGSKVIDLKGKMSEEILNGG